MATPALRVEGLKEFQQALRAADRAFPRELRQASKKAADLVAEGTRASFSSREGVAPKVAPSVKALAQQRGASVRIGGDRYPFAMGSEFGSERFRQFPPPRKGGYSLFPTIRENEAEVVEASGDALDAVAQKAFPG